MMLLFEVRLPILLIFYSEAKKKKKKKHNSKLTKYDVNVFNYTQVQNAQT